MNSLYEKIHSFDRWHYEFNLNGIRTPVDNKGKINRHLQRFNYFFVPLVRLLKGTLKNLNVLDLGCNAGFWSLKAIENGCKKVIGIDGRLMHIEQAELVFQTLKIEKERYQFVKADIFDIEFDSFGEFDVVLCLGLLYHLSRPVELLKKISEVNTKVLVIDTAVSLQKGAYFEMFHEGLDDPRNAVDYQIVLRPTTEAVELLSSQFGYKVTTLKPNFTSYLEAEDYKSGMRKAFICTKRNSNL